MSNDIAHLAIQPTSTLDAMVSPYPEPPAAMMGIPGFPDFWKQMLLVRERDKETLFRLVLTKIANGIAGETSSGINKFTVIGRSVINPTANISTSTSTSTGGTTTTSTNADDEDALLLAWSGL